MTEPRYVLTVNLCVDTCCLLKVVAVHQLAVDAVLAERAVVVETCAEGHTTSVLVSSCACAHFALLATFPVVTENRFSVCPSGHRSVTIEILLGVVFVKS